MNPYKLACTVAASLWILSLPTLRASWGITTFEMKEVPWLGSESCVTETAQSSDPGKRSQSNATAGREEKAADSAALAAIVIDSDKNPFSNTCDGKSIGFVGPTGEPPQLQFNKVPAGATLECRSGHDAEVEKMPFRPCDGDKGSQPYHRPQLLVEGIQRTEVRYQLNGKTSPTARFVYYAHHSLDKVTCCRPTHPDDKWFEVARKAIPPGDVFDDSTRLDNPFVKIVAHTSAGNQSEQLLSLRRTFRLSPDRKLLLIRRTMASRHPAESTERCVGLRIGSPTYGAVPREIPSCPSEEQRPFRGGLVTAHCPDIYCTVSSCRSTAKGCIQVTHTFNRGPGQKPWIVVEPKQCAKERLVKFSDYQCDAYVLNHAGDGVCLDDDAQGNIRVSTIVTRPGAPLGLTVLKAQHGHAGNRYAFSAKTAKRAGLKNVLYLPR